MEIIEDWIEDDDDEIYADTIVESELAMLEYSDMKVDNDDYCDDNEEKEDDVFMISKTEETPTRKESPYMLMQVPQLIF